MELTAALTGVTICLMLTANAALQSVLGPGPALLAVHLVGLTVVLPLAFFLSPKTRTPGPIPLILFTGGLVGAVLLLINNHTLPVLGTGLTVALAVLGQMGASAAVDGLGLFGLTKRKIPVTRVAGLGVAALGAVLMSWGA